MPGSRQQKASAVVEKGFSEALKKFKSRLTDRECNDFQFTTLDGLRRTLLQIQTKQAARSECMHLARLQRFLEGFKQLGEIVEVFLNSSQFVAFVWGPMKFLLLVTCNFADQFDILVGAYEQIGEAIPLVAQHRDLFTGESYMDEVLALMYRDILEFHRRALRIFELPTWRQVFGSVWKTFNSHFEHILKDIRRHKELIESHATVLHFRSYQNDREVNLQKLERLETDVSDRHYLAVSRWLSPADYLNDHESIAANRKAFVECGDWLLKHPTYVAWKTDDVPRSPVLWLNGIPGAGKSVLASRIVDHCKDDKGARVAFFYCKHGDPNRNTTIAVLRTLLSQILDRAQVLLPWCYDHFLSSGQQPSITSRSLCVEIFEAVLLSCNKTWIIVDGLDECDPIERKETLRCLLRLISICDIKDPGKIRLMLASLNEPDIQSGLNQHVEIALKPSDNCQDICSFVKIWCARIKDRFGVDDHVLEYILESTCDHADGMFLYAKLVMINFYNQASLADLERQVLPQNFPDGLDAAYARIIGRISSNPNTGEREIARRVLAWMTCASRPLKWREIQGAISIDLSEEAVDFPGRKSPVHIRDICGSLIEIIPDDRLELVHHTAKRYLVQCNFVHASTSHMHLAVLCLKYLSFPDFSLDISDERRRELVRNGFFAFQDYAAVHWMDHLNMALKDTTKPMATTELELKLELGLAVTEFAEFYSLGEADASQEQKPDTCHHNSNVRFEQFLDTDWYGGLRSIMHHLASQKAKGFEGLDEIGPPPLDEAIAASRAVLENLAPPQVLHLTDINEVLSFYGRNWFKCSKAVCFYFHEGFPDEKSRKQHLDRHDRPFRCTFPDCMDGFKLGFTKKVDLEKHMKRSHPEVGKLAVTFARLRKAKEKNRDSPASRETKHPAKFACDLCNKRFTRASILNTHRATAHENTKPYHCPACNLRFARSNDLRRHMTQVHKSEEAFICKGELKSGAPGSTWGCQTRWEGVDAYLTHIRSDGGKKCIQPLRDEEAQERQLKLQVEQRKAQGLQLPVPRPLVETRSDHGGGSEASFPGTPGTEGRHRADDVWKPFGGSGSHSLFGATVDNVPDCESKEQESQLLESRKVSNTSHADGVVHEPSLCEELVEIDEDCL